MSGADVTVNIEPGLLDKEKAGAYLGAPHLLRICREAGWIVPVVQRATMTIYSVKDLKELVQKIEREGPPPHRPRRLSADS